MTVASLPTTPQLEQLLLQLTVPDTNAIREASGTLKKVLSHVGCVERLLQVLASSNNMAARQLSAVYLRKKIGAHWIKLQNNERKQVQNILLQKLVSEAARPVKIGIAGKCDYNHHVVCDTFQPVARMCRNRCCHCRSTIHTFVERVA